MASKRGFAAMTKDKQALIASRGGKAAHAKGTAHTFTSEESKVALKLRYKKKGGVKNGI